MGFHGWIEYDFDEIPPIAAELESDQNEQSLSVAHGAMLPKTRLFRIVLCGKRCSVGRGTKLHCDEAQ